MSLNRSHELTMVAKQVCRELRKCATPAERVFWEEVRDRRFHGLKFYRQHPLFVDLDGRETFFVADFYCHECSLVVELDGKIHEYHKSQDSAREAAIMRLGISVVRFKNEEVERDMTRVREKLGRFIESKCMQGE